MLGRPRVAKIRHDARHARTSDDAPCPASTDHCGHNDAYWAGSAPLPCSWRSSHPHFELLCNGARTRDILARPQHLIWLRLLREDSLHSALVRRSTARPALTSLCCVHQCSSCLTLHLHPLAPERCRCHKETRTGAALVLSRPYTACDANFCTVVANLLFPLTFQPVGVLSGSVMAICG